MTQHKTISLKGSIRKIVRRIFNKVRTRGIDCGQRVSVGSQSIINRRDNLRIGDDVLIADRVTISASGAVHIGNRVMIGPHTVIYSTTHDPDTKLPIHKNIVIDDDVWIAASATILAGVTIGKCSVVAAGAVVNKDIPANVIVGGVPARQIGEVANGKNIRFDNSDWKSNHKIASFSENEK